MNQWRAELVIERAIWNQSGYQSCRIAHDRKKFIVCCYKTEWIYCQLDVVVDLQLLYTLKQDHDLLTSKCFESEFKKLSQRERIHHISVYCKAKTDCQEIRDELCRHLSIVLSNYGIKVKNDKAQPSSKLSQSVPCLLFSKLTTKLDTVKNKLLPRNTKMPFNKL